MSSPQPSRRQRCPHRPVSGWPRLHRGNGKSLWNHRCGSAGRGRCASDVRAPPTPETAAVCGQILWLMIRADLRGLRMATYRSQDMRLMRTRSAVPRVRKKKVWVREMSLLLRGNQSSSWAQCWRGASGPREAAGRAGTAWRVEARIRPDPESEDGVQEEAAVGITSTAPVQKLIFLYPEEALGG